MKVKWSPLAKLALRETSKYIGKEFGLKVKKDFIQDVRHTSCLLGKTPQMGQIEPYLADLPTMYRSIVVYRLSKIVYYIADDHIEVVDFWDTRREPKSQAERVG